MAKKLYRRIRDDRYQALQELPDQRPRRIAVERENPPSLADPPVPCCDCHHICDDPRRVGVHFNSGGDDNAWPLQWLVHGDTQFHFAPSNPIGSVPTYDFSAGGTSLRRGFVGNGWHQNPQAGPPPSVNIGQFCMAQPPPAPAERPYIIFPLTYAVCGNIVSTSDFDRINYGVKFSQAPEGDFYNPLLNDCDAMCNDVEWGIPNGGYPVGSNVRNYTGDILPEPNWPSGLGQNIRMLVSTPGYGSTSADPVTGASSHCTSSGAVVWKDDYIECMDGLAIDHLTSSGGHSINCFLMSFLPYRSNFEGGNPTDLYAGPLFCSALGGWKLLDNTEADGFNSGGYLYPSFSVYDTNLEQIIDQSCPFNGFPQHWVLSYTPASGPGPSVQWGWWNGIDGDFNIDVGMHINSYGLNCGDPQSGGYYNHTGFDPPEPPDGCFGTQPVYGYPEVEVGPCVTGSIYQRYMIEAKNPATSGVFAQATNLLLLNGDNIRIQCDYSNSREFSADRALPGCYWHRIKLSFNGPYILYPHHDALNDRYALDLSGPDLSSPKFSVDALAMYGPPDFGFVGGQLCTAAYQGDGVLYTVEWNSAEGTDVEQMFIESNSGPGVYSIHNRGHVFLDFKVDEQKTIREFRGGGVGHTSVWTPDSPIPLNTSDALPSLCIWAITVEQAWSTYDYTRGYLELMEQMNIDLSGSSPWDSDAVPPNDRPWIKSPMKGCSYDFSPFCENLRWPSAARYKLGPCSIIYSSP